MKKRADEIRVRSGTRARSVIIPVNERLNDMSRLKKRKYYVYLLLGLGLNTHIFVTEPVKPIDIIETTSLKEAQSIAYAKHGKENIYVSRSHTLRPGNYTR